MIDPFYKELIAQLNVGLGLSLKIIVPSALCGLMIGILVGTVRGMKYPAPLARLLDAYVSVFRGTPLLVQLFVCYFGLPDLGLWLRPICEANGWPAFWRLFYLSPYQSSVLIFSLCSGAYHSEYIRGAILSIKRGQFQAARALGFTSGQTFWNIVIPQAVRRSWPGCGNEIIYLIKYSSLAYIVTATELTMVARTAADYSARYLATYFTLGLYYLALVTAATWLLNRVEKAWAVPGFGRG